MKIHTYKHVQIKKNKKYGSAPQQQYNHNSSAIFIAEGNAFIMHEK
jgi:hypothetical protein